MAVRRLHNDDWGLETNCFVCEPRNDGGLRIPFFHDTERDVVTAEFELDDRFSGAPTLLHGGIALAVLDEAMAWACIAIGHRWAVTSEMSTRFHRGLRVGRSYRVEAGVVGVDDDPAKIAATALISGPDGRARIEADAVFTVLGEAAAVRLIGDEVPERHRGYLRDE